MRGLPGGQDPCHPWAGQHEEHLGGTGRDLLPSLPGYGLDKSITPKLGLEVEPCCCISLEGRRASGSDKTRGKCGQVVKWPER